MKDELKLSKRIKFRLVCFSCFSFLSCSFIFINSLWPCIFLSETSEVDSFLHEKGSKHTISSQILNGTIYCDRSHFRTDICFLKGDIRTRSISSSIFVYTSNVEDQVLIKPYTRKWETSVMKTIDELHLISKPIPFNSNHKCDISHAVPAIFFSTGGYTGNVYHEFNDGIIPLYITSRRYKKKVVFVILEYHNWWYMKYARIISQLSDYPPIDFKSDSRTHCFQEAIVGLRIHNELTIDSTLMEKNETILDFRGLISQAFEQHPQKTKNKKLKQMGGAQSLIISSNRPKLVILSRNRARSITNENSLIKLAHKIGFIIQVLHPKPDTELITIYNTISMSDVLIGVHGAAMTHFLFLKPGSTVIQVVPLGTDWAAETYYGEPAKKYGLKYIEYKVHPRESSLYYKYDANDPVLRDPNSVNRMGWEVTKKIYLDDQYVTLDLKRVNKILMGVYANYFGKSTS